MFRTFNMGIGFIIAIAPQQYDNALKCLRAKGEKPIMMGEITARQPKVVIA
jgi:phosphoribosylformylglycinamidine cyclo-ligase